MAITTVREAELANYRDYVIGLMRKAELPTRTVTVMHRNLFAHAEVPWRDPAGEPRDDQLGWGNHRFQGEWVDIWNDGDAERECSFD